MCGAVGSYQITTQQGGQVIYCKSCRRNFDAEVRQGQFMGRNSNEPVSDDDIEGKKNEVVTVERQTVANESGSLTGFLEGVHKDNTPPVANDQHKATPFLEWYNSQQISTLPWHYQMLIWLFAGYLWIPIWYFASATPSGSIKQRWSSLSFGMKSVAVALLLFFLLVLFKGPKTNDPTGKIAYAAGNKAEALAGDQDDLVKASELESNRKPNEVAVNQDDLVKAPELESNTKPSVSTKAGSPQASTASLQIGNPQKLGTLEELGKAAYDNLDFANVDKATDIQAVPLSEDFAQSGVFAFRTFTPHNLKASMSRQQWEELTTLGFKESTAVDEINESFDIRISKGEPRCMIEWHDGRVVLCHPIIRIGAVVGERWDWTNEDISRKPMLSKYSYRRCVEHNGVVCVMIESELHIGERYVSKHVRWYAEGIGLVKESYNFMSGLMEHTKHRVILR